MNEKQSELTNGQAKSRDAFRVSKIKELRTALELYSADKNSYPAGVNIVLGEGNAKALGQNGFVASLTSGASYINPIAKNSTPGGEDFMYTAYTQQGGSVCTAEPCQYYTIDFSLEEGASELLSGQHTATPLDIN